MQLRCDARLLRYLQAKHWEHRESTVVRRVKREGLSKRVMVSAGMKHEHMNTFFLYFGVQRPTRSTLRIPFDFKGAGTFFKDRPGSAPQFIDSHKRPEDTRGLPHTNHANTQNMANLVRGAFQVSMLYTKVGVKAHVKANNHHVKKHTRRVARFANVPPYAELLQRYEHWRSALASLLSL